MARVVEKGYNYFMEPKQLRDMKGWTLREAADRLNEYDPELPLSFGTLHHVETDGTYNIKIIRAIATVYGFDIDVVERGMDSLKNSRKNLQETPVLA